MIKLVHRANDRGVTKNHWLHSHHSFSFSDYYNAERMGVGKLRVLNDDVVAPGRGFAQHPHANMEIVSIPLSGALLHKDNLGNQHVINTGEVQIMSAGNGIRHSEYNQSSKKAVNFLQIWILPKLLNIDPRYDQKAYDKIRMENRFFTIVSPRVEDKESVWINQDAIFSLGKLDEGVTTQYNASFKKSVYYFFIIEGEIAVTDETLYSRDAIALSDFTQIDLYAKNTTQVLCST